VERGDLTAVCDAMYKLVTDPEHLKKLKDNAKNKQREWILSHSNVLQWNKILLEVVSEKGKINHVKFGSCDIQPAVSHILRHSESDQQRWVLA